MGNGTSRHCTLGTALIGTQWAVIAKAIIVVLCRLYVRCLRRPSAAGFDDLTIVIASALSIFIGIATCFDAAEGIGMSFQDLNCQQRTSAMRWLFIITLTHYFALFFVRLSIAIFIFRRLPMSHGRIHRKLKLAVWTCLLLNLTATILVPALLSAEFQPISLFWSYTPVSSSTSQPGGKLCLTVKDVQIRNVRAYSGLSAATDLLYACLPIAMYWPLNVKRRVKIDIAIISLFAILTCACAIGGAVTISEASTNITLHSAEVSFWCLLELSFGIITACLPSLREFSAVMRDDISRLLKSRSYKAGPGPARDYSTIESRMKRSEALSANIKGHRSPIGQSMSMENGIPTGGPVSLNRDTISVRQDITVDEVYTPPPAVYVRPLAVSNDDRTDAVWSGNSKCHGIHHAHAESLPL